MAGAYQHIRLLNTVKTYPQPSQKSIESVCTAGIREDGQAIRVYPVPYRLLADDRRFRRYQWITARAIKSPRDSRPESYVVDEGSIEPHEQVGTANLWAERKHFVMKHLAPSVEELQRDQANRGRSLGLIRPIVKRFYMKPTVGTWSAGELAKLTQTDMFRQAPQWTLEKLPFEFHYEFACDAPDCPGNHDMQVLDWEVGESYRKWRREYGPTWWEKMHQKYGEQLVSERDLHFYMGTLAAHQTTWTIVGLFYPPKAKLEVGRSGPRKGGEGVGDGGAVTQFRLPLEA